MPPKKRPNRFLNIRKIRFVPWEALQDGKLHQGFVPYDLNLGKKLGIAKTDQLLFFAGAQGDWARALAQHARVGYTDASKSMRDYARGRGSQIHSFRTRPAELQPRRKSGYDWSVSFEPFPLFINGMEETLSLTLVRSLLNRKGAKIVFRMGALLDELRGYVKTIRKLYGATANYRYMEIQGVDLARSFQHKFYVVTLHTNPGARKMAKSDLAVLHYCNTLSKKKITVTKKLLQTKFGLGDRQLERVLNRISEITPQYLAETIE